MAFPQVTPKHVKEAYRLLNKSIIRVDQPEVHLEEEEEEEEEVEQEETANGDANEMDTDEAPKRQLRLSYEEYR